MMTVLGAIVDGWDALGWAIWRGVGAGVLAAITACSVLHVVEQVPRWWRRQIEKSEDMIKDWEPK